MLRVVFKAQLVQVKQVTAALLCVQDGDDLPPDPVLAQPALSQGIVADVQFQVLGGRFALVEPLARPELVRFMGHARRGRKVGFTPVLVQGHA
ncbi:hypothetical protein D3C84_1093810 [compost metagenome]